MTERLLTLLSAEEIAARVRELGAEITREYAGKTLVLVCVLKGSFVFAADLARAIDLPVRIDFLGVRSYGVDTETSGVVQITHDLSRPIEHEHVLLVEDIVDTGLTIALPDGPPAHARPASVRVCALLHKPARARIEVKIDFLGFTIEDRFVVGYGLDFARAIPEPALHRRRRAFVTRLARRDYSDGSRVEPLRGREFLPGAALEGGRGQGERRAHQGRAAARRAHPRRDRLLPDGEDRRRKTPRPSRAT